MSEKDRKKAGLHKKISSIFGGVVVPKSNDEQKSSDSSTSQETNYTESLKHVLETQVSEPSQVSQPSQTLPEDKQVTESPNEPVNESEFDAAQDSGEVAVEESEIESAKQSDGKPASSPNFLAAQDSEEVKVEESEIESAQQSDEKPASPPKFLTAQDSKVIPIEESDVELAQQSVEKSAETREFITANGSKVIPILESDVDPSEQSKAESTHESKIETTKQDKIQDAKKAKVIPVKQRKAGIASKKTKVKVKEQNFWNQVTAKLFTPKPGANPAKQKVMVIMIPVLFIFLIIFVVKGGVFGTGGSKAAVDQDNNPTDAASAVLSTQIEWKIPEPYPATLRDPMRLGPVEKETEQEGYGRFAKLKVKGILIGEDGSSSAIIGNRIVHEGEQIKGVNVIKINKNNVEFEVNGETWTQEVQG